MFFKAAKNDSQLAYTLYSHLFKKSSFCQELSLAPKNRCKAVFWQSLPFRLDDFDFDVHTGRKVHVPEGFHDLLAGVQDIQEALMHPEFELLPRILIDEGRPVHGIFFHLGRERNRTHHFGIVLFRHLDDLADRIIDQLVIVRADAQTKFLRCISFLGHELFSNLGHHAGADGLAAFADGEAHASSMAIGAMSLTLKVTVSPGMTISTPSGSVTSPVTSVVRM
jgi:hypothetical protein